jgi:uncharacterized DUF497 family protein
MDHAVLGFDWDAGNRAHCRKHGVPVHEIESLFQRPVTVIPDLRHSDIEERLQAIGKTTHGRHVFVVFTTRERDSRRLIRPISARFMHRGEVERYEKENPDFPHGRGG